MEGRDDHGLEICPAFSLEEVIQEGGCLDTLDDPRDVSAPALQFKQLSGNRLTVLMEYMKMNVASLIFALEFYLSADVLYHLTIAHSCFPDRHYSAHTAMPIRHVTDSRRTECCPL